MWVLLLVAGFPGALALAQTQAAAEVKSVAYQDLLLDKEHAKPLKGLLSRLAQADSALWEAFHKELAGALVQVGPEGGLRYAASAARWEWTLPPAAVEFAGVELGGDMAWMAFARRALLEKARIEKLAGTPPEPETLARASKRLPDEPAALAALDQELYGQRAAWKIGVPPRRRTGKAADQLADAALGVPVVDGGVVLVGDPEDLARLRKVLRPLRADAAARPWLDALQVLWTQDGVFTAAAWFFEDKEVGVALGISGDARSAAAVIQAGLVDKVRGRGVAVAGDAGLDWLPLSSNMLSMAVWWHDVVQVRNPPTAKETEARMLQESADFLVRNGGRAPQKP
ncbi:MAG: hypothetical protein EYC70_14990 [Planctomycetota bacterium]|nr:MAG: hypothetical protein EYC70_14990 [Planctomycetota bacterium]